MPEELTGPIEARYREMTPRSAQLMERAGKSMPRGLTRTLAWFAPYPVVFDHASGASIHDVDGNRYIDLFCNGLSLIHGHSYPPIEEALQRALPRGTAWPGASEAQIEFAEMLCDRIPGEVQVRFANTGTEATMLAVKLARHVTGRQVVVKAWHAYHGSYDDLEVGLQERPEEPGRVALATFGELDSYAAALERGGDDVAAIIVEPVQYTGVVTPPPDGFLQQLKGLADDAGVLLILDDCLMFRLAEGGSAERFGFEADMTCLGKWIGGGLPVGVLAAPAEMMASFDLHPEDPLYHGGSFNGNVLGMVAGTIALRDLSGEAIARINDQADRLRAEIAAAAATSDLPLRTAGVGSAFGVYVLDGPDGEIDWPACSMLHLAAVTRGVYFGSGGEFGLPTVLSEEELSKAAEGIGHAIVDVASARADISGAPAP
jgi:glutamate-1-semialdehyde 2,1-aminomutase